MADEDNKEPDAAVAGMDVKEKAPAANKRKPPVREKRFVEPAQAAPKATSVRSRAARPGEHSEQDRIEKLRLIETQVSERASTLKDAIKSAGISDQTYYNWKRTAKPAEQQVEKPAPAGDEFADLIQLEKENHRLRKLLADKLRAENAELRKRLGLD